MKALTETIISLFELAEAEGRLLRQNVLHTFAVALLLLVAAMMLLAAMGLLVTALYYALLNWLPPSLVFLSMALVALCLAGGILWLVLRLNHKE
jgi:ABC-type transport system involved in cytochrome c biogenesis permease subunit